MSDWHIDGLAVGGHLSEEPRYTLAEAKLALSRKECRRVGHDYNVVEAGGDEPVAVACVRCGKAWAVKLQEPMDWGAEQREALEAADRLIEYAEAEVFEQDEYVVRRLQELTADYRSKRRNP